MGKSATRRKRNGQNRAKQRTNHQGRRSLGNVDIESVVRAAVYSTAAPDGRDQPPDATFINHLAQRRQEAADALARELQSAIEQVWSRYWQPADVVRAVERLRSDQHARIAGHGIVAQLRTYPAGSLPPRWQAQLDAIETSQVAKRPRPRVTPTLDLGDLTADDDAGAADACRAIPDELAGDRLNGHISATIEVLVVLRALPKLPKIGPRPGETTAQPSAGTSQVDSAVLQRVTSLLAKAESTTFVEEAEALTTKAQQLMARHAIDMALVEANRQDHDGQAGPTAGARRIGVEDPYAGPKAMLLGTIAEANRCRSVWSKGFGFATVFGDEVDLDTVELLYTSLLVQSARAMISASRPRGASAAATRQFRQSFLIAFATRIGERLTDAVAEAVRATEATDVDLLPVLANREAAADRACEEAFPSLRSFSATAKNVEGWHAGRSAADRAHLDLDDSIGSGHDKPLAATLP